MNVGRDHNRSGDTSEPAGNDGGGWGETRERSGVAAPRGATDTHAAAPSHCR